MTLRLPLSWTNRRLSRYYAGVSGSEQTRLGGGGGRAQLTFLSSGCAGGMLAVESR